MTAPQRQLCRGYRTSAMPLLDSCERYFGTRDLYTVLSVGSDASDADLRRAYRRQALLVHPDRAEAAYRQPATASFQVLGKVHVILSNKQQRALYDEQGIVNERCDPIKQVKDWDQYFRHLFKKVNVVDIKSLEEAYRDSEEERDDLQQAYLDFEGDMDRILEVMLCARNEDEPRFRKYLEMSVGAGDLPDYPAFSSQGKRKRESQKGKIHYTKDFENFEHQSVIKFLVNEGVDTQTIYERMFAVYCERCPNYNTVEKWASDCKHGYESVEDGSHTQLEEDQGPSLFRQVSQEAEESAINEVGFDRTDNSLTLLIKKHQKKHQRSRDLILEEQEGKSSSKTKRKTGKARV